MPWLGLVSPSREECRVGGCPEVVGEVWLNPVLFAALPTFPTSPAAPPCPPCGCSGDEEEEEEEEEEDFAGW